MGAGVVIIPGLQLRKQAPWLQDHTETQSLGVWSMVLSLEHSRYGQSLLGVHLAKWTLEVERGQETLDRENRSRDKSVTRQEWRKGRGWWRAWQQASSLWGRGSLSSGTQERGCARRPWEQGDRPALR